MIEKRHGKIVMCSSEAARAGSIGEAVYSACKGAVVSFMKALAKERGRYNINVNCVSPGFIDTPLIEEIESKFPSGNKKREDAIRQSPLRRTGKPEEVAHAYLFLASDNSSFITGQVLSVNGGAYL
jgi:2-hydroxycyclohexanecarboxyl-CoA dehydrogenase